MRAATVSSDHRITIPREIREPLHLEVGQKVGCLVVGKSAHLVPQRPVEELRVMARGVSMEGYGDKEDRC